MIEIIVCEDSSSLMGLLRSALAGHGIAVKSETRSAQALMEALRAHHADLVLMDVHLPELSGVDAISELRLAGYDLPVILMSADHKVERQALAAGAAGFFYKGSADLGRLAALIESTVAAGAKFGENP